MARLDFKNMDVIDLIILQDLDYPTSTEKYNEDKEAHAVDLVDKKNCVLSFMGLNVLTPLGVNDDSDFIEVSTVGQVKTLRHKDYDSTCSCSQQPDILLSDLD